MRVITIILVAFVAQSAGFQVNLSRNPIKRLFTDTHTSLFATGDRKGTSPQYSAGSPRKRSEVVEAIAKSEDDADSDRRRQLLFSLLTSSMSATLIPSFPANAEATLEATIVEEESIANAFKNAAGGKLIIPPMDTRSYDTFTLPNGLKVILCSDPSSNTASAAMDVHVGAASDPDDVPGLAHFTEHMLFLGTKNYPEEASFESFLSSNGGSSNAFTDSENTVYYFDITADNDKILGEGLDRFGSFFTGPLFTESSTMRELNAIESENAKNLQSDVFRLYQIEKSRSNSLHPYSKFYTGNKATLLDETRKKKLDLRTELIKFWSTYYSGDQMALAIVAPQSISLLKEIVLSTFGEIPTNKDRLGIKPEQAWAGKILPFAPGTSVIPAQNHVVEVVPVADLRQVILTWPILFDSVQDKESQFLNKPAVYLSHLLGHEGPESLVSYLKKQGWVNGLGASTDAELSDFYTFQVSVQLTKKGLDNIDTIVEAVYSYINMLKDKPTPRYVYEEVLQLSELGWRFLTAGAPGQYAQSLAQNLLKYPESLVIAGPRRMALRTAENVFIDSEKPRTDFASNAQFDDTMKSTSQLLSKLTVDNCIVAVVSKSFGGKAKKQEKWYGTKYNVKPLSLKTANQWRNCKTASNYGIDYPRPNVFIPEEKGLIVKKPIRESGKRDRPPTLEERLKPITPPKLIRDDGDNGRWTVYFKQDDTFGQPKSFAVFQILTKDTFSSPIKAALAALYQVSANDRLQEYAYDASLADLSYDIQVLPRGVRLTFGGYNDKLLDFATYISKKLSKDVTTLLPDSKEEFERYRDELRRAYAGFDVQQPYSHAIYYTNLLLQPKSFQYTNAELRDAIEKVNLDDLADYVKKIWDSGKAEALLQGNLDEKEALQFVDVIDATLAFETLPAKDVPGRLKALPIPITSPDSDPIQISTAEPNPSNTNAAVQITFQCLDPSEKAHVVVDVLSYIITERFYEDLRTKQQLGYIVSCGVKAVSSTRLLSFVVQSSVAPPEKLNSEILKFIDNAKAKFLDTLTDSDVKTFAKALLLKKTDPDKRLASEATRNWNEIATGRLQFDRRQKEAEALLNVKKDDILSYWDDNILGASGGRRMLISEVVPKSGAASSKAPAISYSGGRQLGINNVESYRKDREKEI